MAAVGYTLLNTFEETCVEACRASLGRRLLTGKAKWFFPCLLEEGKGEQMPVGFPLGQHCICGGICPPQAGGQWPIPL